MPPGSELTPGELDHRRVLGQRMARALEAPPEMIAGDVALRIGVHQSTLSRCLRGEGVLPAAPMALFADVTGFAVADLLNPDEGAPLARSADPRPGTCPAFRILIDDPHFTVFLRCDEGEHGPGMHHDARYGGDGGTWWMNGKDHDLAMFTAVTFLAEYAPRGSGRP